MLNFDDIFSNTSRWIEAGGAGFRELHAYLGETSAFWGSFSSLDQPLPSLDLSAGCPLQAVPQECVNAVFWCTPLVFMHPCDLLERRFLG